MNSKTFLSVIIVILLAAVGYLVYTNYLAPEPQPAAAAEATPTAQPAAQAENLVSADGKVAYPLETELSFTQPGRVKEVLVQAGASVKAGDVLARLETDTLEAAKSQAQARLDTAQAALQAAQNQLDQVRTTALQAERASRAATWEQDLPVQIDQPAWYFTKSEEISSTQKEADAASQDLQTEQKNLQDVLNNTTSADLVKAEKRLSDANIAFMVAQDVLDKARKAGDQNLQDQAQTDLDAAQSELDAAQASYNQILSTDDAAKVTEARARVAVAQERYDNAMNRLDALRTGEDSPEVRAAKDNVSQAQAAVQEAETGVQAAQTAVDEAVLLAPADGTIVEMDLQVGEVSIPGQKVMLLASSTGWQVHTTDLSESDVALIKTGMTARITLDAFPNRDFHGTVQDIALTSEDNRGEVTYAVKLDFDPGDAPVRSGMTAFVEINTGKQ